MSLSEEEPIVDQENNIRFRNNYVFEIFNRTV